MLSRFVLGRSAELVASAAPAEHRSGVGVELVSTENLDLPTLHQCRRWT